MLPVWFSAFNTGVSFLDAALLVILLFYTIEGLEEGVISALYHFVSFLGAFLVGIIICDKLGSLFSIFGVAHVFASAVSFFLSGIVSFFVFTTVCGYVMRHFFGKKENTHVPLIYTILGVLPGFFSGCLLLLILLILAITLPLSSVIKQLVSNSYISSVFLIEAQNIEQILHGDPQDTLLFTTITPDETVVKQLGFTVKNVTVDDSSRQNLLAGITAVRNAAGIAPFFLDPLLTQVAQDRATTMLQEGYLSYFTKEGLSLADRMAKKDIMFSLVSEDIAFSPSPILAMSGFMGDQKEKNNILSNSFHRIGIGVTDGGMYGKMFVIDFAD